MPSVPVEIRWSDEDERRRAVETVQDVDGRVVRELDGLIEAEVPGDVLDVLATRKLLFSFPQGVRRTDEGLAAAEADDLFPTRVAAAGLPEERARKLLQDFSARSLHVGVKRSGDAFIIRKSPRKILRPEIDGLGLEAMAGAADDLLLPEPAEALSRDAYLVKLAGAIEPAWRAELEAIAALGDHRPPDTFRMVLDPAQLVRVQALAFVRQVKRYGLLDTLTPGMLRLLESAPSGHRAQFELAVHQPAGLEAVEALLANSPGVRVLDHSPTALRFELEVDSPVLSAVAQLPAVRTLGPFEPPKLFLDQARPIIGADAPSPGPAGPWDGTGEAVAVFDSGIDPNHPDIAPALGAEPGRFQDGEPIDVDGHGTHVAGIIAGRGIASGGRIRGVAPGANLFSFGMVTASGRLILPIDLGEMLRLALTTPARVINLSWGKAFRFDYDIYGESLDRFVWENPQVLVVVAAGNEGMASKKPQFLGFHEPRTIGMPAAAKNVVTVGACCNRRPGFTTLWGQRNGSKFSDPPARDEPIAADAPFPAANSSRGPTGFDAVKPDVLAPGTMVASARATGPTLQEYVDHPIPIPAPADASYGYLNGTSMAAPMVAGTAAILRQYLRVARGTPTPSAALMKALLILSAGRIAGANAHSVLRDDPTRNLAVGFPDFDQGFGVIDLRNVLEHPAGPQDRKLAFRDVPSNSELALEAFRLPGAPPPKSFRVFKLAVPHDSATPLRVALVWTDPPGRYVQNQLNLEVRMPDGTAIPGNPERRMFVDEFLLALGSTVFDKVNTVQLVTIPNPVKAVYRVTVRAAATTAPPQGYALAACGPLADETFDPLF